MFVIFDKLFDNNSVFQMDDISGIGIYLYLLTYLLELFDHIRIQASRVGRQQSVWLKPFLFLVDCTGQITLPVGCRVGPPLTLNIVPDNKVHGANMGPVWGRQDPCGPHVSPANFAIWGMFGDILGTKIKHRLKSFVLPLK